LISAKLSPINFQIRPNTTILPKMYMQMSAFDATIGWADSLENLIRDANGRALLRGFAVSEHSEENLLFWEAVESLRQRRAAEVAKQQLVQACKEIYNMFLSPAAPQALCISGSERSQIDFAISCENVEAIMKICERLQSDALEHLQRDVYPRFLRSEGTEFASKFSFLPSK
jgi:regulator of G-protein signaling